MCVGHVGGMVVKIFSLNLLFLLVHKVQLCVAWTGGFSGFLNHKLYILITTL